jgi:hypothetical protein
LTRASQLKNFLHYLKSRNHVKIFRNPTYFPSAINNPLYWRESVTDEQIQHYLRTGEGNFQFGYKLHPHRVGRRNPRYEKPEIPYEWDVKKIKKIGDKESCGLNVRRQNFDMNDKTILLLQTSEVNNIVDLTNMQRDPNGLDAEVNTVIVIGYFPVSADSTLRKRGLAVLKHRGSNHHIGIVEYKITDSGFQIAA